MHAQVRRPGPGSRESRKTAYGHKPFAGKSVGGYKPKKSADQQLAELFEFVDELEEEEMKNESECRESIPDIYLLDEEGVHTFPKAPWRVLRDELYSDRDPLYYELAREHRLRGMEW
jgi:hypothetical protein